MSATPQLAQMGPDQRRKLSQSQADRIRASSKAEGSLEELYAHQFWFS
jgi:hypothetical protein